MRPGGCIFRVSAPNARQVAVAGLFIQWSAAADLMMLDGNGYWSCDVAGASRGDTYKFVITDKDNKAAATNGARPNVCFVVILLRPSWSHHAFHAL